MWNCRPVALGELVGIGERLKCGAEGLGGNQVEVLDVVCELRSCTCTGRLLRHRGESVPDYACGVSSGYVERVEDTTIDTGLVETVANLIPLQRWHYLRILSQKKRLKT
jgi:hypothetical protein